MSYSFIPFSSDAFSGGTGTSLKFIYDSNVLIDGARAYGGAASALMSGVSSDPVLFYGPLTTFEFIHNAEYTLSLNVSVRKNTQFISKMEIYLIGPAFSEYSGLGYLVTTYTDDAESLYTPFEKNEWNFDVRSTGHAALRFVIYGGQFHISDVSIKPSSEFGFTPDEVDLMLPVDGYKNEFLTFKTEFYGH
jgi:hypothetical protein